MRWVDNLIETTALLGEPGRCVHIGDRGADIYELFCAANDVGAHFVIRSAYPRLADDRSAKTDAEMKEVRLKGVHRIGVRVTIEIWTHSVRERNYKSNGTHGVAELLQGTSANTARSSRWLAGARMRYLRQALRGAAEAASDSEGST